jgi:hypothetical protein
LLFIALALCIFNHSWSVFTIKEPLNKSPAAGERIFFVRSSASKAGNTQSIPLLLMLRPDKKSLAPRPCRFNQRFLRQHRAIRQEVSDRIFAPIQSLENEGILYMYFPFFKLKKWGKKTAETRRRNCAVVP